MKIHWLLTLTAGLAISADASSQDGPKKEIAKLQGTWKGIALEAAGKKVPEESVKPIRVLIKGNKISLSGKEDALRPYRLDPGAKPKAIDIPGDVEKEFSKGIYEVEGDTLKLCFSHQTSLDRPKDFNTAGTKYFSYTLKREKP